MEYAFVVVADYESMTEVIGVGREMEAAKSLAQRDAGDGVSLEWRESVPDNFYATPSRAIGKQLGILKRPFQS